MKRKLVYLMAVWGVALVTGCNSENATTDAMVTVEEIPIDIEEEGSIQAGTDMVEESTVEESLTDEYVSQANTSEESTVEESTQEVVVNGSEGIIRIGTIGTPYTELLEQAKVILAADGWDVQVEVYDDYEQMNQDVLNGTLDAHLFAHQTYLNSYNDVNGTNLVAASAICYEIYGVYSLLNEDLTGIKNNVSIGVPQEDTKKARALLFLQDMGHLTLKEGVGLTAILEDVVENPKNIQFVEYTPQTVSEVLETVDYCIMGADQAILAGFEPQKDVLKQETPISESAKEMVTLLVTTEERTADEKWKRIEDAIKSDVTKKYMTDTYKGAWGLFP